MALSYFFTRIDPSIIILGALFLIFFTFINYILSKVFRDKYGNVNRATAGIIAFCISVLAIYGISRTGWNIGNFFYSFGISDTILWVIGIIVFIVISFFVIKWLKLCGFMMIFGAALVIISFTNLVYEQWIVFLIGIILFIIGAWLCIRRKKKRKIKKNHELEEENPSRKDALIKLAKKFKRWANSTSKPAYYGSWAMFINKLHHWGYGRNESEIIYNFGVTQDEFVKIFNRYGKV